IRQGKQRPQLSCLYQVALRRSPRELLEIVRESGLRGCGGAGFPVARKWEAMAAARGDRKVVVCNADESEPGTFKDRTLLDLQPRRVLAGLCLAAATVGAQRAVIYVRHAYDRQYRRLGDEIDGAIRDGLLAPDLEVVLRRGAGLYVCGEETALLNSLEGRRPVTRERPPYPTTAGLLGLPTLIHNVETLAALPAIVARGAGWYRAAGRPKLYCVSGDVGRQGVLELPMTTRVRELLSYTGCDLQRVKAFTLGGLSGGLLPARLAEVVLDYEGPAAHGAHLGSGAVIVLSQRRCLLRFVLQGARFFARESCGRCFPCRIGTERLCERLDAASKGAPVDHVELRNLLSVIGAGSACGLGGAAATIVGHLLEHFGEKLHGHAGGGCEAIGCEEQA
ncbi:NADH-ubiquinone oxidoreductase-F iron-sulfur binding region domain-containing protein, partial [Planctomycetota bacterium]